MASGRVKVVGYSTKVYGDDHIKYRNFTDDLVGSQQADSTGALPYSYANIFDTEINNEGRLVKNFKTNKFSNFITLSDIDLSDANVLDSIKTKNKLFLNYNKTDILNYSYFGSLREFIRVSLENIILKWPASIYLNSIGNDFSTQTTVEDYQYDLINDESTFKINVNHFDNPYGIRYMESDQQLSDLTIERNLVTTYINGGDIEGGYNISASTGEFNVTNFTGSTDSTNSYVYLKTNGNPFPSLSSTTSGSFSYHIKPNKIKVEKFFNELNDFESHLLNRYTVPKYSAIFRVKSMHNAGNIIYINKEFVWPVTDGYNLDFQSNDYIEYVNDLISFADEMDETQTDILTRFLVADSITEFDTIPGCDGTTELNESQKITKTFRIYGREFDEIKRYADGIKFAHSVSYDKKDNVPDALAKSLAYTMGWDLTNSIVSNDLLTSFLAKSDTLYSGQTIGMSLFENEIEFWRRLIINTPWLWRSKGTRKGVEFLLKMVGTPQGLIDFNEYVYTSRNQLDVNQITEIQNKINDITSLDGIPISSDGYPLPLPNSSEMYFQGDGLWFRETAGSGGTLDKLIGNNPHIGPYDGGNKYMNQFNCLIPNFSSVTLVDEVVTTATTNLFTYYNYGTFDGLFNYGAIVTCTTNDTTIAEISTNTFEKCEDEIDKYDFTTNWSMNIYYDNIAMYSGDVFYTGNTTDDYPTNELITEFNNAASNLELSVNVDNSNSTIDFIDDLNIEECEISDLVGTRFKIELCVRYIYGDTTISVCDDCRTLCDKEFETIGMTTPIHVDVYDSENNIGNVCYDVNTEGIEDPFPELQETECGCEEVRCDNALKICIKEKDVDSLTINDCDIKGFEMEKDGYVLFTLGDNTTTNNISSDCCKSLGFIPLFVDGNWRCVWDINSDDLSSTFSCKDLIIESVNPSTGLVTFTNTENNMSLTIVPDSQCCEVNGLSSESVEGGYNCYQKISKNNKR